VCSVQRVLQSAVVVAGLILPTVHCFAVVIAGLILQTVLRLAVVVVDPDLRRVLRPVAVDFACSDRRVLLALADSVLNFQTSRCSVAEAAVYSVPSSQIDHYSAAVAVCSAPDRRTVLLFVEVDSGYFQTAHPCQSAVGRYCQTSSRRSRSAASGLQTW